MNHRSIGLLGASLLFTAGALSAPACSSSTDPTDGSGGAGGQVPENSADCPKMAPFLDQRCSQAGLVCRYLDPGGFCPGAYEVSTCHEGDWSTVFNLLPSCQETEPCPATPPVENTGCNATATCSYCQAGATERYACTDAHTWLLAGGSAGCD